MSTLCVEYQFFYVCAHTEYKLLLELVVPKFNTPEEVGIDNLKLNPGCTISLSSIQDYSCVFILL